MDKDDDDPAHASRSLQFFIANKNQVLIVSLVGKLTHENRKVLGLCQKEILASRAKWVILYFRDVGSEMDRTLLPELALLLKSVREAGLLRLCSIHPELRKFLESQGLLRMDELANNLTEALKSLPLSIPMIG